MKDLDHKSRDTETCMRLYCQILPMIALIALAATPADLTDLAAPAIAPPEQPAHDVWIEGETGETAAGWFARDDAACYGGKELVVYQSAAGDYQTAYAFNVETGGKFLLMVAGQPTGTPWTSPIRYRIDEGEWRDVTRAVRAPIGWGALSAVTWTLIDLVELSAGGHRLSLAVNQPRQDGLYVQMIDAIALVRDPYSRLEVRPRLAADRPGNVFVRGEPVRFGFRRDYGKHQWQWRVTDWLGSQVAEGQWEGCGRLEVGELALGYYRLHLKSADQSSWLPPTPLAVVVDPSSRTPNRDSAYAMDSAQSWASEWDNVFEPHNVSEVMADLQRLAGLTMVRDRMSWACCNPAPDVFDFGHFARNAALLAERGIGVCQVFHDMPAWTLEGLPDRHAPSGLPHDLFAVYRFCREAAAAMADNVTAWEFWNEPNGSSHCWPTDFATAMKAAYLGYKAGNPDADVLVGSDCIPNVSPFVVLLMENGVGDYFDVYNFHLYSTTDRYAAVTAGKRGLLERYGVGHKPIWVTENGLAHEDTGRAPPLAVGSSRREHDEEQERMQAEHLVKSQIVFQSEGVERDFFFLFKPYNEYGNGKVWGIFRWDWTPKPAYSALSNLIAQLGDCRYLGRMDLGGKIEGYLFETPAAAQVLVHWSADGTNQTFELAGQQGELTAADLIGAESQVRGPAFSSGRYPVYLRGLSGLRAESQPESPPAATASPKDLTVVMRILLGEGFGPVGNPAAPVEAEETHAVLEIFNFSDRAKEGRIESVGTAYQIAGLPERIAVAAMAKTAVPLVIRFHADQVPTGLVNLKLEGRFEGQTISPLCARFKLPNVDLAAFLEAVPLPAEDASRWRANSSGTMEITSDPEQQAVRFHVQFGESGDRWVYPEFPLRWPQESLMGAAGIGFEIKADTEVGRGLVMAVLDNVPEVGPRYDFVYRQTTEWQKVQILFESDAGPEFDPASVRMLRIGANPTVDGYTYWIRNVRLYYRK